MTPLEVIEADITTLAVDAIVNAANERMLGGGGVDAAIHRAAGPELRQACLAIPEVQPDVRCPTGTSRITPGFNLPAKYVIHTVGPIWHGGQSSESRLLAACYRTALALAGQYDVKTIAFPAISCGAYGYPLAAAATIAVAAITSFPHLERFERVLLVGFDEQVTDALHAAVATAGH